MNELLLATRKSPLAMTQSELVAAQLREVLGLQCRLLPIVSTGDRQSEWSLEKRGGKGLFTAELEASLLRREADLAVHSTKDLPGDSTAGLAIAGYLPRADARDVLVVRSGVNAPSTIATGSPRRRCQLLKRFPSASFSEIRGNVDTRLKKIASGLADATVLAAAGLARLGIAGWPGLEFRALSFEEMVPAIGQGAIAVQCRAGEALRFSPALDAPTARAITIERAFQSALGAGCHTAVAAHVAGDRLHFFHQDLGYRTQPLAPGDAARPAEAAIRLLKAFGIPPL